MAENSKPSNPPPKPPLSRFGIVAGVIVLFLVGSYLLKDSPLDAGEDAPVWQLPQANGAEGMFSLDAYRGQVVLLDFWSTSCPPCLQQIPILQRIHSEFSDVKVVGVAVGGESLAQLKTFATRRNVSYPLVQDAKGVAATVYNVSSLPTLFIVNPEGVIIEHHQGYWPEDELLASLRKALKK